LFPEDLDWSCLTLPKWGMLANGELWERTTQEPDTSGIGAGFGENYPTPTTFDATCGDLEGKEYNGESRHAMKLIQAVKRQSWPTPNVRDCLSGESNTSPEYWQKMADKCKERGINKQYPLRVAVNDERQTWPTPKTRDWKDSMGASLDATNPDGSHRDRRDRLMGAIVDRQNWATPQARDHRTGGADRWDNPERSRNLNDQAATLGNGGQLNPDWVEWLMGWPISWTQLDPLDRMDWRGWDVDPADLPPDHPDYVPRIATDIPNRIDRLRAIGNGQVPQAMVLAWNELTTNKEN
jgi:hypothetical protein